jgi:nucleoside-diphosphate-sugar epimerase
MRILILGGTAWLGRDLVRAARDAGHEVAVLARGEAGAVPEGATAFLTDRQSPGAYDDAASESWDAVIDVTRHPGHARSAVAALGDATSHWVYVSSCSVYADMTTQGVDETGELLPPLDAELLVDADDYGSAKVACEQAVLDGVGAERVLIARPSLIGGPADWSGRGGYWPLRFAHPAVPGRVLVPDAATPVQLLDVRDLADWLIASVEKRTTGIMNVAGPTMPLTEHLSTARAVAGYSGELVQRSPEWLAEHDVSPWAGPRSLPLWLPTELAGLNAHDTTRAREAGLVTRPLEQTLADMLAWELAEGAERPRKAGLSDDEERELLAAKPSR